MLKKYFLGCSSTVLFFQNSDELPDQPSRDQVTLE